MWYRMSSLKRAALAEHAELYTNNWSLVLDSQWLAVSKRRAVGQKLGNTVNFIGDTKIFSNLDRLLLCICAENLSSTAIVFHKKYDSTVRSAISFCRSAISLCSSAVSFRCSDFRQKKAIRTIQKNARYHDLLFGNTAGPAPSLVRFLTCRARVDYAH